MDDQGEQFAVRKVAVEHNHSEAKRFVDWYKNTAKSRFANAFAYGLHKVDVLLDETLKERAQALLDQRVDFVVTQQAIHEAEAI